MYLENRPAVAAWYPGMAVKKNDFRAPSKGINFYSINRE